MKWPWKKPIPLEKPAQQLKRKLTNSQRKSKTILPTNNNNNPKDGIKTTLHHSLITSLRVAITVEFLATGKKIAESYNKTNKIGVINITLYHSNLIINYHHQLTIYQDLNIKVTIISLLIPQNQFTPQNRYQINNNRINLNNQLVLRNPAQPKLTHYHTQSSYLTIPEEQDFYHTALLKARIAENANLSDIFSFEFEANESLFLLNNAAANKQKAITAMYTEAEVKRKAICLILDSGSAGNIITYQLMQHMKKTPVGEIDNFPFTLDGITISVKVLVMDAPQYQALTQELTISYQRQHARIPATCGTFNKHSEKAPAFKFEPEEEKPIMETFMALGSIFNWADKTEQQYFSTNDSLETKEPVTTK
ncbi:hypothetical protein G9A89_012149 [Geosiphon pyriformis]|nr:hypothetical protein G9A89_012149 [Geosiphon pyriformis]